ncbi:hypothetical protein TIFTF001_019913 [Ficus carica]|uniref:Uncharacterized protein n=1 Tax=Ficus carica TaxID=3494 RepID=A0AA88D9C3_FICCA|nr:hypothetical protein TIFTF001_019913 [Ficus carica]
MPTSTHACPLTSRPSTLDGVGGSPPQPPPSPTQSLYKGRACLGECNVGERHRREGSGADRFARVAGPTAIFSCRQVQRDGQDSHQSLIFGN